LIRLTSHYDRARFTAAETATFEVQATIVILLIMAGKTAGLQQRPHVPREIRNFIRTTGAKRRQHQPAAKSQREQSRQYEPFLSHRSDFQTG
jgi:hypothetical protein